MARTIELLTPLGDDVLMFHRMNGTEELGRLSEYELDVLSKRGDINLDEILGKNVTVKLELPNNKLRYFNGYVTRFTQVGTHGRYHLYRAMVRPWLWFLTRTSDCRIFQEMKVPDIVKQVFDDHPQVADVKFELSENYVARVYCVQYRETDFRFVSRLMEEEGIYYYFRHVEGRHTLVVADSYTAHSASADCENIAYVSLDRAVRPEIDYINEWHLSREIQPGAYVLDDFDFEKPRVDLKVNVKFKRNHELAEYEMFDYPGEYLKTAEGEHYVRTRIEELQSQFERVNAKTNARGAAVGNLFKLTGHARSDQNREHLIIAARYQLEYSEYESMENTGTKYECTLTVLDSSQPFRPERVTRKTLVQGPQTAIVVGPKGDEIYTDKYGRVKVQFHWDRYGKEDENSSCWIRVSHPWAGKGWGSVSIPRIGQEVIVDFLEGDPDQPIITGRVYNADSMPPYGLPGEAVVSGLKSNTHKGKGYNEISANDTAGKEKITIHGQYDMNSTIEHDQTSTVHNNRTDKVDVDDSETVGNNQTQSIGVNQDIKIGSNQNFSIGANQTGKVGANQSLSVGANQSESVGGFKTETISIAKALSIGAAYQVSVGAAMNETIGAAKGEEIGGAKMVAVGGISVEVVGGSKSIKSGGSISATAAANVSEKAGANFSASAASDFSGSAGGKMSLSSGGDFVADSKAKAGINAASELVLKCGGASITLKSGGEITIKGTDITISGSGKIGVKAGGDVTVKGSKIGQN